MNRIWRLLLLVGAVSAVLSLGSLLWTPKTTGQPLADAAAGKAFWEKFPSLWCLSCHGVIGEGAYGPDLAGRSLSVEQFNQAVRQPWGVMPAYTEGQVSDQNIADMVAYLNGLPKVAQPGPWRTTVPQGAPLGYRLLIETAGCSQCHGSILANVRREAGGEGADFHWFQEMVYEHTNEFPTGRMGNYSKARLPEIVLNEIWRYLSVDVGLRAAVNATMKASTSAGITSYELTVENAGTVGKGLAAENMYIAMRVPAGSTVVSVSDRGYQGIQPYVAGGYNVAVWLVPSVAAGEKPVFTLRVSGSGAADGAHAFVRWLKPTAGGEYIITAVARPPAPAVISMKLEEPIGEPPTVGWKWVVAELNSENERATATESHGFFWVYYAVTGSTEVTTANMTKTVPSGEAVLIPARQQHSHRYFPQSKILIFDVRDTSDVPTAFHQGSQLFQSGKLELRSLTNLKLRIREYTLPPGSRTADLTIDPNFGYVLEGILTTTAGSENNTSRTEAGKTFTLPLNVDLSASNAGTTPVRFILVDVHP